MVLGWKKTTDPNLWSQTSNGTSKHSNARPLFSHAGANIQGMRWNNWITDGNIFFWPFFLHEISSRMSSGTKISQNTKNNNKFACITGCCSNDTVYLQLILWIVSNLGEQLKSHAFQPPKFPSNLGFYQLFGRNTTLTGRGGNLACPVGSVGKMLGSVGFFTPIPFISRL